MQYPEKGIAFSRMYMVGKLEKPFGRGMHFQIEVFEPPRAH